MDFPTDIETTIALLALVVAAITLLKDLLLQHAQLSGMIKTAMQGMYRWMLHLVKLVYSKKMKNIKALYKYIPPYTIQDSLADIKKIPYRITAPLTHNSIPITNIL